MMHAKFTSYLKLIFCVIVICLAQLLIGCSYVFSSTLLAQLREPTSTLKLSMDEASWIASISVLVCPIGLIITGILTDKIGRKKAILIVYLPMIVSWLILVFANSYRAILIARIILGFPFGSSTCEYLYIAEISPVNARPIFFSTVTLFVGCGILMEWILAMFFRWNTIAAILCGLSVVGFFAVLLIPESPMWLRAQGRDAEADRVDKWFGLEHGGGPAAATATTATAAAAAAAAAAAGDDGAARPPRPSTYWSLYTHRTAWKPTLITSAFLFLQQWSGVYVLLFYSVDVFRDCRVQADGVTVSAFLALARVLGGVVFAFLYRLRRRTLMVVSGACAAASLSVIVAYVKAFDGVDSPPYGIVLALAFILFMFFNLLGILPLPWILCGEVFPMAVKGTLNGVVQTWGYFVMFLVIKMYPTMVSSFGVEIVLSIFAACCLLNILFGVFVMPETKGKSLDQIISYFDTGKKNSTPAEITL